MAYPSTIDSYTAVNGTTLLSTGHADNHNVSGSAMITIETKLGIGAGTPAANQVLIGSGAGTSGWSGTWNAAILGTPAVTGGTYTSGVVNNATVGTPAITGGTINSVVMGTPAVTGGTWNAATLGTPTIGTITVPGTVAPLSFSAAIAPVGGSLVDTAGTTWTVNAQAYQIYYSVLGTAAGNRTITTPLNPTAWQPLTFTFKASGSANGTLVWGTAFQISQDAGTPALGTSTSWNYFAWRYNPVSTKWDNQGNVKNLI